MLIWVAALHCEAKPVIDFYRLKKSRQNNPFDLYLGDGMECIVGGVGKLASASACAWIAGKQPADAPCAWINLGTAGAAEAEIGSLFALDKVIDGASGQRYYPAPGARSLLSGAACITLERESTDYDDSHLYDMEASGFMHAALRFSSAELVQSLKIVSDNRERHTGRRAQAVSDLIHNAMPAITRQAEALLELEREVAALFPDGDSWQRLLALAHFSQTQQSRLRSLWRYLLLRDFDADAMLRELSACASGKAVLQALEQKRHQDSARL